MPNGAKTGGMAMAHQHLDQTVALAYDWADYSPVMPDAEILKRLLALNLARSENDSQKTLKNSIIRACNANINARWN